MKQKLIIMVGLPGSGKSTKAQQVAGDNGFAYISRDFIRSLLCLGHSNKEQEICKKVYLGFVEAALLSGESVIADATHLNAGSRAPVIELGKKYGAEIVSIVMNTSYETCILRNVKRDEASIVPTEVIRSMRDVLNFPNKQEGFDGVYLYNEGEDEKWE